MAEPLVVHDVAKRFAPDFALADAGVAVDARCEFCPGIVEVKRQHFLQTQERIHFGNRRVPSPSGAQIAAGFEEVRGVDTEAEALRSLEEPYPTAVVIRFHCWRPEAPVRGW